MAQRHWLNNAPSPDERNSRANGAVAQPFKDKQNASNVTELRWRAAQWRKHVAATGQDDFLDLMQRAAAELETEADRLEGQPPLVGWREPELLAS